MLRANDAERNRRVWRIQRNRLNQPEAELCRKADKARTASHWTQEDMDLALARAEWINRDIEWE